MKTPFTRLLSLTLATFAGAAGAADYIPGSGWQMITFDKGPNFNLEGLFNFSVRAEQHSSLVLQDLDDGGETYSIYDYLHYPYGNWAQYSGSNGSWPLAGGSYSLRFFLGSWWQYSPNLFRARFRVEILPEPILPTTTPREQVGCIGREVSFRATAKVPEPYGAPFGEFSYQWLFNGTNALAGETNSRVSLTNLSFSNEGFYSCAISNQYGGIISPPAYLRVLDACVGLNLYAGLSITGVVGRTYFVDYITNVTETNWTSYATNTLTQPTWLFIDTNTPIEPKKFFRVRLQPSIPIP